MIPKCSRKTVHQDQSIPRNGKGTSTPQVDRKISIAFKIAWDCTESCRSETHATQIAAAISKKNLSDHLIAYYLVKTCRRFAKVSDSLGKTALHFAAACGRLKLCQWLVTKAGANLNAKDQESGFTPLHAAIFHNNLDVAIRLIELGAGLDIADQEFLPPLSLLAVEVVHEVPHQPSRPCQTEVYVYGSNLNYTLGVGTDDSKKTPEVLEYFRRNSISIKQVCMEDFHTVFVSNCGQVYVCGHGQGGRLGIGNEKPLLVPTHLRTKGESCLSAAVGLNHTLLLLLNGEVLCCGSNDCHQLGISPYAECCPSLRYVNITKTRQFGPIVEVRASKYHSVFVTARAIFACGLNAGQLGGLNHHLDFFTVPEKVADIKNERDSITCVATSVGSICFSTLTDVFVIHQFKTRKIMKCNDRIVRVDMYGGHLSSGVKNIEGGDDLTVVWLTTRGIVHVWHEKRGISLCSFSPGRILRICDITLRFDTLFVVSYYGEAFSGKLKMRDSDFIATEKVGKSTQLPYGCSVNMERMPNIYRALSIANDPKGRNVAVIQRHPHDWLDSYDNSACCGIENQMRIFLEQANEFDSLHDILFKVGSFKMAAHRFVLLSRGCSYDKVAQSVITVPSNIPALAFKALLTYLYSGSPIPLNRMDHEESSLNIDDSISDIIRAAEFLGCSSFAHMLQKFARPDSKDFYHTERCRSPSTDTESPSPLSTFAFSRCDYPELQNVEVVCEDRRVFKVHKCILAARMEYFNHMFTSGWAEASGKVVMLYSSKIVEWILDFLYTGELPESFNCNDLDHIIKLLIASDQYLIDDLKDTCAELLSRFTSLKNCAMILQLAVTYNVNRLKNWVGQFILHNICAVVQNRSLELLDDALLQNLTREWKKRRKNREICTFFDAPPDDEVFFAALEICGVHDPTTFPSIQDEVPERRPKPAPVAKKKATPRKPTIAPSPPNVGVYLDTAVFPMEFGSPESPSSSIERNSFTANEFPSLSASFQSKTPSTKCSPNEPRRVYPPKLSQKQRKKLSAEFDEKLQLDSENNQPKQPRGWLKIAEPQNDPLDLSLSSVEESPRQRDSGGPSMIEIIATEQERRNNWKRMTSKPFYLTEMEDTAILALKEFYCAGTNFDERITVERVVTRNVAEPTWMPSGRISSV